MWDETGFVVHSSSKVVFDFANVSASLIRFSSLHKCSDKPAEVSKSSHNTWHSTGTSFLVLVRFCNPLIGNHCRRLIRTQQACDVKSNVSSTQYTHIHTPAKTHLYSTNYRIVSVLGGGVVVVSFRTHTDLLPIISFHHGNLMVFEHLSNNRVQNYIFRIIMERARARSDSCTTISVIFGLNDSYT